MRAILQWVPKQFCWIMSWKLILLTHWGRVMHICNSKLKIIGSDNGLSPDRRQAIIWTNAVIFSIWPLGTNFSEISIEMHTFSFKKMHWKMSSTKWWPFCLSLKLLKLLPHLPVANELIFKLLRITRILEHQDPFYLNGSTLSLAWISNNIHNMYKVWDLFIFILLLVRCYIFMYMYCCWIKK